MAMSRPRVTARSVTIAWKCALNRLSTCPVTASILARPRRATPLTWENRPRRRGHLVVRQGHHVPVERNGQVADRAGGGVEGEEIGAVVGLGAGRVLHLGEVTGNEHRGPELAQLVSSHSDGDPRGPVRGIVRDDLRVPDRAGRGHTGANDGQCKAFDDRRQLPRGAPTRPAAR